MLISPDCLSILFGTGNLSININRKINYLRLRRVERSLAEIAGRKHFDEEGLAPVVRPDDGVFADQIVRPEMRERQPPVDVLPLLWSFMPPMLWF